MPHTGSSRFALTMPFSAPIAAFSISIKDFTVLALLTFLVSSSISSDLFIAMPRASS